MSGFDVEGDIGLDSGVLAEPDNTLAQWFRTAFLIFRGTWVYSTDEGVPYFETFLGQRYPLAQAREVFRGLILQAPGLKTLDSLELTVEPKTRTLLVSFRVNGEAITIPAAA